MTKGESTAQSPWGEGGWEAGEGGRGRAGGGRGRGDGEEEVGRQGKEEGGGGSLSFALWRGGKGEGSGGGGERHLFLKLREVWEESFSVPSPFFLLCGCLRGEGVWRRFG